MIPKLKIRAECWYSYLSEGSVGEAEPANTIAG